MKKTIWFCVVMLTVNGQTTLHKSTNRMEVEEFTDMLNLIETNLDVEYKVMKGF